MAVAAIPYIMMAVAAAASAAAAVKAGNDQKKLAEYNASIARSNAEATQASYNQQAANQAIKAKRMIASQEVALSATGVVASEGSPLAIMASTASNTELDKLTTLHNGQLAYIKGMNQANGLEYGGDLAQSAGYMKAGTSLLAGAASVAGGMNAAGMFSGGGASAGASTFGSDAIPMGDTATV